MHLYLARARPIIGECINITSIVYIHTLNDSMKQLERQKAVQKFVLSTMYSLGSSLIWLPCLFLVLGMVMRT
jgi:hypothetical protein